MKWVWCGGLGLSFRIIKRSYNAFFFLSSDDYITDLHSVPRLQQHTFSQIAVVFEKRTFCFSVCVCVCVWLHIIMHKLWSCFWILSHFILCRYIPAMNLSCYSTFVVLFFLLCLTLRLLFASAYIHCFTVNCIHLLLYSTMSVWNMQLFIHSWSLDLLDF